MKLWKELKRWQKILIIVVLIIVILKVVLGTAYIECEKQFPLTNLDSFNDTVSFAEILLSDDYELFPCIIKHNWLID